jgi:hypothetical protein
VETLYDSLRKGRRPKKIEKVCLTPISFLIIGCAAYPKHED